MKAAADPVRAAARRRLAEMAWLAPLVAIGLFCLVNRLNESGIGFNDAAMARGEPSPVAAMRHLFPTTNPELDDAVGRASGKQEDLARAVAFFRGWMRTRTDSKGPRPVGFTEFAIAMPRRRPRASDAARRAAKPGKSAASTARACSAGKSAESIVSGTPARDCSGFV